MKRPYKLPLKFILLWIVNLAVLLMAGAALELNSVLQLRDTTTLYLVLGAGMALLEQELIDRIRGEK